MEERRYVAPGWMAVIAAALTLPMVVLGLILEIAARKNPGLAAALLLPYLGVVTAQTACGLFALGRLKTLLNEKHRFHDVDGLIVMIIILACLLTLLGMAGRIAMVTLGLGTMGALFFLIPIIMLGIALAAISIVFAVKLLRLESDLGGLLKPFVYINIAGAVCVATIILAPLGLALDAVSNILLAMIFFRQDGPQGTPEFV